MGSSSPEARLIVGVCAVVAGTGVASAVSPGIEDVLNVWVGTSALVLSGSWVAFRLIRSAVLSVLIAMEVRAANQANHRAAEELRRLAREESRDA